MACGATHQIQQSPPREWYTSADLTFAGRRQQQHQHNRQPPAHTPNCRRASTVLLQLPTGQGPDPVSPAAAKTRQVRSYRNTSTAATVAAPELPRRHQTELLLLLLCGLLLEVLLEVLLPAKQLDALLTRQALQRLITVGKPLVRRVLKTGRQAGTTTAAAGAAAAAGVGNEAHMLGWTEEM